MKKDSKKINRLVFWLLSIIEWWLERQDFMEIPTPYITFHRALIAFTNYLRGEKGKD